MTESSREESRTQKMSKEKVATELKKIRNHYQKTEERSRRKRKRERRHRKKLAVSQLKKKVDVRETQLENVNLVTLRATAAPMTVVIEVVQETLSSGPLVEVMEGTMMEEVQMVKVDRAHLGIHLSSSSSPQPSSQPHQTRSSFGQRC